MDGEPREHQRHDALLGTSSVSSFKSSREDLWVSLHGSLTSLILSSSAKIHQAYRRAHLLSSITSPTNAVQQYILAMTGVAA